MLGLHDPSVVIEESESTLRTILIEAGNAGSLGPDTVGAAILAADRLARIAEAGATALEKIGAALKGGAQ